MPARSDQQRKLVFAKRGQYETKSSTPEKWKWVWDKGWENKGDLPEKVKEQIKEVIKEVLKESRLTEASHIDYMYILKALKEYKSSDQSKYDLDKLIDSISVDLEIRNKKDELNQLKDYIEAVIQDDIDVYNENELKEIAKEILNRKYK